jgi:hypothetical protein
LEPSDRLTVNQTQAAVWILPVASGEMHGYKKVTSHSVSDKGIEASVKAE